MSKFNFMTPATTASGFSFAPKPATPTFGLGGSSFSNPPGSAPAFGTSFGTPTTSAPSFGASFGTPATSAPGFGASFGTPATTAPNFGTNFNTSTGFGFGAPTTSAPSTGLNFGATTSAPTGGLNFGTTSAAPTLSGFNFGGPTITTSAPSTLNFSFGAGLTNTASTQPGFGGLSFGKPTTTQGDATKPVSVGLGGVDSSTALGLSGIGGSGVATSTAGNQAAASNPRMVSLPPELGQAVEAFKTCIKERKQISSDIARNSIRPLHKVKSEADSLLQEATELNAKLTERRRAAGSLRARAAAALPAAERAHRTAEAPHGVEYESGEAIAWIVGVVTEGEGRLRLLKRQLEAAQRQLSASPKTITDQDLALGMRKIHESFVAVAGRLQAVHQLVEAQKTQYLALRKNVLKDPTDVFASKGHGTGSSRLLQLDWSSRGEGLGATLAPPPSTVVVDPLAALGVIRAKPSPLGPTPFSILGPPGFGGLTFPTKPITGQTSNLSNSSSWGLGQGLSGGQTLGGSGLSLGGGVGGETGGVGGTPSPFALQKPPAGNKRGKH